MSEERSESEQISERSIVKVVLVGSVKNGKTALSQRMAGFPFPEIYQKTMGVDFVSKNMEVEKTFARAEIWNTTGDEITEQMLAIYFKDGASIAIVVDGTKSADEQEAEITKYFETIENLYKKSSRLQNVPRPPIHILVNKADLLGDQQSAACLFAVTEWNVKNSNARNINSKDELEKFPVFICSAKTGRGTEAALQGIMKNGLAYQEKNKIGAKERIDQPEPQKKRLTEEIKSPALPWREKLADIWKNHKAWLIGNGGIIAIAAVVLILGAVFPPATAALAFGGMSALAVSGIISGSVFASWNIFCAANAIFNAISKKPPGGDHGPDQDKPRSSLESNREDELAKKALGVGNKLFAVFKKKPVTRNEVSSDDEAVNSDEESKSETPSFGGRSDSDD